ncbi:hypothetical protein GCM10007390_11120 [Persicitalea jodogahamensis]|uniref:Glycosyl transferase family 1 domain-containing protein n=1 Tax=Persicitalea jodogahamensis TaxID=402147 RepID=A0A8J3G8I6_9BACT|nr:hypothetical protein GCM10007390_11120 [Persicitalea jodogahamensis]
MGRVNETKNIPLAIDAIRYLRDRGLTATLDIYGTDDGGWEAVVNHIAHRRLQEVVQLKDGLDPALRFTIFQQYSFLIQLSRAEGMAMSVAEAMQHGLVCVVTPVGEIPNYSMDLDSAIFINIGSPDDWEESLRKLENVVKNPLLYEAISKSCYHNFKEAETYADTLVTCLDAI